MDMDQEELQSKENIGILNSLYEKYFFSISFTYFI